MKTIIWYNEDLDQFLFTIQMESDKLMLSYDGWSYNGKFVDKDLIKKDYELIGEL